MAFEAGKWSISKGAINVTVKKSMRSPRYGRHDYKARYLGTPDDPEYPISFAEVELDLRQQFNRDLRLSPDGKIIDTEELVCVNCKSIVPESAIYTESQFHPWGSTVARETYAAGFQCPNCGYSEEW